MASRFDSFVVFAEMRTGSNFLETNLNALDGITCHGEAFNPYLIGYPEKEALLGITQEVRDEAPELLLDRIKDHPGLAGFRYFHDHDPRVLDAVLDNPRCAKLILTRDPLESYISLKIARETGQWKLTDLKGRKDARVAFDAQEFSDHLRDLKDFHRKVAHRLQVTGQTAFRLSYEDLLSVDVINGVAAFLGIYDRLEKLDQRLKVQNPAAIADKVTNRAEMEAALAAQREVDVDHVPDFEPRRVVAVPSYVTGAQAPLLYLPIRGGSAPQVTAWMAALDQVEPACLPTQMSQKDLRHWKREQRQHRSFTVIRHPVVRAHHAYCGHVLGRGPRVYAAIRRMLAKRYNLPIPPQGPGESYDLVQHRAGFAGFLGFLKPNLNNQTAVRIDPAWCSQSRVIQGFADFALPDLIVREEELPEVLPALARAMGYETPPPVPDAPPDSPFELSQVYDDEIEALTASAYQRDYMIFGFDRWR